MGPWPPRRLRRDDDPPERRPVILAVDDDPDVIELIGSELEDRYGRAYQIVTARAATHGAGQLTTLRESGDRVALVLSDQWLPDGTGCELLAQAARAVPARPAAAADLLGRVGGGRHRPAAAPRHRPRPDRLLRLKPWRAADELFHRTVTEFLHEWVGSDASLSRELTIVADAGNARAHELRSLLTRNRVPFVFHATDLAGGRADPGRGPAAGRRRPGRRPAQRPGAGRPDQRRDRQRLRRQHPPAGLARVRRHGRRRRALRARRRRVRRPRKGCAPW